MINFDDVTKENINKHNSDWPQIPDHPYGILVIEGSWSGKINALLNLIESKMMKIIVLSIKFIYILMIRMKQNINNLLKNVKRLVLKSWTTQRLY